MRRNVRASKVPSQRSWPPCHATKQKALWPLVWISATRRAEDICRFFASPFDSFAPAHFSFQVAHALSIRRPLGQPSPDSLVLRTASQATTRLPPLVVVALLARARPLRVTPSTRAFNQASGKRRGEACRRHGPPSRWGMAPLLGREVPFKNQQMLFSGLHGIKTALP